MFLPADIRFPLKQIIRTQRPRPSPQTSRRDTRESGHSESKRSESAPRVTEWGQVDGARYSDEIPVTEDLPKGQREAA